MVATCPVYLVVVQHGHTGLEDSVMKRAELIITLGGWRESSTHIVSFDSADEALANFERISALLKRRADKENDIPRFLDVEGSNRLTCDFDQVCAVGFLDLKKADDDAIGLKDAFPHLSWKP